MSADQQDLRPHAYHIWGTHGGFFLTSHTRMSQAFDFVKRAMLASPELVFTMEIEAYTLDRLARGRQLDVEDRCDGEPWKGPEILDFMRSAIADGRMDNVSTYTQPILHALDGEAVVRQFGYARRIQRETLGIELEYYATQEPCWCGQLPAILAGLNMKGCVFETSWGPFGFAPLKNGETFRWRGPDGTEIPAIPMAPFYRTPLPPDPRGRRQWDPWCNPAVPWGDVIQKGYDDGLDNPLLFNMSLDHTPGRPEPWFNRAHSVGDDCRVTFITPATYFEIARDDGLWEDAFDGFTDRMCWGVDGGELYLHSQVAANKTILTERLGVLAGLDVQDATDRMWQATMAGHHHDAWLCWSSMFGQFRYDSYFDLTHACRLEVERRMNAAIAAPEGPAFRLANPTQRDRDEWAPIDIPLPAGVLSGEGAGVRDADGQAVPSRLAVAERHADGSAARVTGHMRAAAGAFATARYTLATAGESAELPVCVEQLGDGAWRIANDRMRVEMSPEGVRLFDGEREILSDLHLHANVDGWDCRGQIAEVTADLTDAGRAAGRVSGQVGTIPFVLELALSPWGETMDIDVTLDYAGERTEGANYWDVDGSMKLMLAPPAPAEHLCHKPFELREPTERMHSAVHFTLTEWADGGFCTILDRPSGVLAGEEAIGIVLCHSGWSCVGRPNRTGVTYDGMRFCNDISHGQKQYALSVAPFAPDTKDRAVWAYQRQAYPLTPLPDAAGPLPAPDIAITGHSLVSALYREGEDLVVRLWNPLAAETVEVTAPGMQITATDLEARRAQALGIGAATVPMRPMQIQTLHLRPE